MRGRSRRIPARALAYLISSGLRHRLGGGIPGHGRSSQSVKRSRSSVKVANTRTGFSSRPGGTATNISRVPTPIPAAFGSNTGRSSKHIPLLRLRRLGFASGACRLPPRVFFTGCSLSELLSCKQRPSCAIEDTLPNGISWLPQLLTTALRTELGTTLMIGVLTTHHCHNGLLPSLVAPSQDAEMAWQNTSSLSALPRPPAGPHANERPSGSVRGAPSNWCPYGDQQQPV
jgi:hypothetical protein